VTGLVLGQEGHSGARAPQGIDHPLCIGERRADVLVAVEDEHRGADERFDALRPREVRVHRVFELEGGRRRRPPDATTLWGGDTKTWPSSKASSNAERARAAEDKTSGRTEAPERPSYGLPCERGLAEPRYQLAIGEDRRMA